MSESTFLPNPKVGSTLPITKRLPAHHYLASSALCSVVAFPYDFGWFVLVVIFAPRMESVEAVPTDLFNLIEFAGDLGVEWLQIDEDGERYDELPFYE